MNEPLVGLLTGPIGVGKTTVAERVAGTALRRGLSCGGLLAPALVDACGPKAGIWGVDLPAASGASWPASTATCGPRVGPYSFDGRAGLGLRVIEEPSPADLVVVDESESWAVGGGGLALLPRLAAGEARRALILARVAPDELQARLERAPGGLAVDHEAGRDAFGCWAS